MIDPPISVKFNRHGFLQSAPPDPAVYGFEGDQSTGGSTTIRLCWIPMRKAGAVARLILIGAAAKRWLVAASECRTAEGKVFHSSSSRLISAKKPGGVGETATASGAAALCNAIYAATGIRVRILPVS